MKRYIKSSRSVTDLWADIVYIYGLIVNQGNEDYIDEYTCTWMQLDAISNKGYAKANKKYKDLYDKVSNSYIEPDGKGNYVRIYND